MSAAAISRAGRIEAQARAARRAQPALARTPAAARDALLRDIARRLREQRAPLIAANALDLEAGAAAGLGAALLDRLRLDGPRLDGLAIDVETVANLADPLAGEFDQRSLPNGLQLARRTVPIGVVGVIYEARPNVTVDIAAAALKSGNAVVLRGGREARQTNLALVDLLHAALSAAGLPADIVSFIDAPEREAVSELLQLSDCIDVMVPRGGQGLIDLCRRESRIPLIAGGVGVVHVFVDASADLEPSLAIIENAKVQRPAVCNALDTLLVHRAIAPRLLPALAQRLSPFGVIFHAEGEAVSALAAAGARVEALQPEDFDREWLGLQLGVRVVEDLDIAIAHIARHGSGHSEAILSEDAAAAERFLAEVDAAAVYHNASTRFTDGGQFGMGVEVAVATGRLHPRGPVGPAELTSFKWVGRADYLARS
ncbi:glutamate-5-semialdehyde dehydrogenase [Aquimonas sp.]|jgi:glutamate-5-semialdehyde dehydrogenase|uniref:glutamate-5-semialdehyde dehydrogenase n=1 Tax=Aquimonas sp. TaxID=1872588 RepID=UPI0037BE5F7A